MATRMWQLQDRLKVFVPERLNLSGQPGLLPPFITYCGTEEALQQDPWTAPSPGMAVAPMGPAEAQAVKEIQQSAHELAAGAEEVRGYARWISSGSLAAGTTPLMIRERTTHTGSRVWEGSLVLLQWACENPQLFTDRSVLELGAGCGLLGLAVAKVARPSEMVVSDFDGHYTDASTSSLVELLLENATSNLSLIGKASLSVWNLDWTTPSEVTCCWPLSNGGHSSVPTRKFEVILGAELLYSIDGAMLLLKTVSVLLADNGVCFLLNNSQRSGVPEFIEGCPRLGLGCEQVSFEKPAAGTVAYAMGGDELANAFVLLKITRLKAGVE